MILLDTGGGGGLSLLLLGTLLMSRAMEKESGADGLLLPPPPLDSGLLPSSSLTESLDGMLLVSVIFSGRLGLLGQLLLFGLDSSPIVRTKG